MLRCSTENVSEDSNFEKPVLTSEGKNIQYWGREYCQEINWYQDLGYCQRNYYCSKKGWNSLIQKFGLGAIFIQLNLLMYLVSDVNLFLKISSFLN